MQLQIKDGFVFIMLNHALIIFIFNLTFRAVISAAFLATSVIPDSALALDKSISLRALQLLSFFFFFFLIGLEWSRIYLSWNEQ